MQLENVSVTREKGSIIEMDFEIPSAEIEAIYKKQLKKAVSEVQIPGFRKGKAPEHLVEREYGLNVLAFTEERIIDLLLPQVFEKAGVTEADLVARPRLRRRSEFAREKPFQLHISLPVYPAITPKDYLGVKIRKKKIEATAEMIDEELKHIAEQQARFTPVDRAAADGDLVVVDTVATDEKDEPLAELSVGGYSILLGRSALPKEFEEAVRGLKPGEEKTFSYTVPADHANEALRSKTAKVVVKLTAVKEKKLPPIDDELAKDLDFESLDKLKEAVKGSIERHLANERERQVRGDLMEAICKANPVEDLPQVLVEESEASRWRRIQAQFGVEGVDHEEFAAKLGDKRAEVEKSIQEQARILAHEKLLLRLIARAEKITITDDQWMNYVVQMARAQDKSPEAVLKKVMENDLAGDIKNDCLEMKTLHFLLEKAEIEEC